MHTPYTHPKVAAIVIINPISCHHSNVCIAEYSTKIGGYIDTLRINPKPKAHLIHQAMLTNAIKNTRNNIGPWDFFYFEGLPS